MLTCSCCCCLAPRSRICAHWGSQRSPRWAQILLRGAKLYFELNYCKLTCIYLSLVSKSFKKSASVYPFQGYLCEASGKAFTHNLSLREHEKYACNKLKRERRPKVECSKCGERLHSKLVKSQLTGMQNGWGGWIFFKHTCITTSNVNILQTYVHTYK